MTGTFEFLYNFAIATPSSLPGKETSNFIVLLPFGGNTYLCTGNRKADLFREYTQFERVHTPASISFRLFTPIKNRSLPITSVTTV